MYILYLALQELGIFCNRRSICVKLPLFRAVSKEVQSRQWEVLIGYIWIVVPQKTRITLEAYHFIASEF